MIPARDLVSHTALSRYDDTGEPVYTTYERVLLVLRWFDWTTAERLLSALDLDDADDLTRRRYVAALGFQVRSGKIEQRRDRHLCEYRLKPPSRWAQKSCRRCKQPVAAGHVLCAEHVAWQRENKRRRRAV